MITELAPGPERECEWGRTIKNIVCAMDQNPQGGCRELKPHKGNVVLITSQFKLFSQTLQSCKT